MEEAEKAKEQAKQDGFDVCMAETEEALRVEVLKVCKCYFLQVWNEAPNQARVEASSALRRAENVYYPSAICASSSSGSQTDTASKEIDASKDSPAKALPSSDSLPKEVELLEVIENDKDTTKGVVPDATKPLAEPKDPSKVKEVS